MKKLAASALAFATALALFACGDDSSTSSGGGGSANYAARKTQEIAQKIGNAMQTGDFSELEKYGIDAECARDDACMSIGIGRMLQEAGIGDIEPECLLDEECYGPWMDSVYGAADWTISGDPLYDNACHVSTSEGICLELAWNSALVDAEDAQDYRTACGTLDAFVQPMMGGAGGDGPSTLGKLFEAWGVKFEEGKIVCDLKAATKLNNGQGGVDSNPAFLSLGKVNMDKDDLLVAELTNVMFPFAGAFSFEKKDMDLSFTPVITTSKDNSCAADKMALQSGGRSRFHEGRDDC